MHERLTFASRPAIEALNNFAANLHSYGSDAQAMALKQLMELTHRQGVVIAFADGVLSADAAVRGPRGTGNRRQAACRCLAASSKTFSNLRRHRKA
jgi:hypothetical protein